MTELTQDLSLAQAKSLIDSYAFDLGGKDPQELLNSWLEIYSASWIGLATVEALYLGRYKAVSIEHILNVWLRIGTPNPHFTYEFERLICRKLPKHLSSLSELQSDRPQSILAEGENYSHNYPQTFPEKVEKEISSKPQTISENIPFNTPDINGIAPPSPQKIPLIPHLRLSSQTDWSEITTGQKMIRHFIPVPDVSSFFNKLKTFGEEKLEN